MKYFFLICTLLFLGSTQGVFGQEIGNPYIRNYKPQEYHASSANYGVVQDSQGLMYFANYQGILEYDGGSWNLIPITNNAMVREIATDSSGQIYASGIEIFGYLAPDSLGKMSFNAISTPSTPSFEQTIGRTHIIGTDEGAFFWSRRGKSMFHWRKDSQELKAYDVPFLQSPTTNLFYLSGELYATHRDSGLLKWAGDGFQLSKGGELLRNTTVLRIVPFPNGKWLIRTFKKGFFICEAGGIINSLRPFPTEIDRPLEKLLFSDLIPLDGAKYLISTVKGGAYIMDLDGRLVRKIDTQSGLQDDLVISAFQDRQSSLWLALSKGISRVEIESPLSQWDETSGLKGIVFSSIRHKGTLYATTPLGVFFLKNNRFYQVRGIDVESWKLLSFTYETKGNIQQKLLVSTIRGLYEIKGDRAVFVSNQIRTGNIYQSPKFPNRLYTIGRNPGIHFIEWEKNKWTFPSALDDIKGTFKHIIQDQNGDLWLVPYQGTGTVTHIQWETDAHIKVKSISEYDTTSGLPPVISLHTFRNQITFATESGIFTFDPSSNRFVSDTLLGINEKTTAVTQLAEDPLGNVWVERVRLGKKWIEWIRKTGANIYIRDSIRLRGLANTEVWGSMYPEANGINWIGTPNGLYGIQPFPFRPRNAPPNPLIRTIHLGQDSVIFPFRYGNRGSCSLDYRHNSMKIRFSAPFYEDEFATHFQHFLEGKDEEWSDWSSSREKEYALLPPGRYIFHLKAKNLYEEESATTSFAFEIAPPWYRTVWAYIGYGLLAMLLIYGMVLLNTQRLHVQNENLERIVFERTAEIWDQHKEIVKKTVALKRQKEELSEQHDLLEEKNQVMEKTLDQLKSTQSKLVDSEKMASLGQLTAGIAHEINNPINFVKGNISPLKKDFEEIKSLFIKIHELKDSSDLKESVEKIQAYSEEIDAAYLFSEMELLLKGIEEGAMRTKLIVDGLKVFSRSEFNHFKPMNIHDGIDATLTLLNHQLKGKIEVVKNYGDLPMVECLSGKINQVFMNVLSNAIQAIDSKPDVEGEGNPPKGTIKITTSIKTQKTDDASGDMAVIQIEDDGPGISKENIQRIFEPFFTTKDVGKGTGLGLSISFGIIEKHKGSISVTSNANKGATFTIMLPFHQEIEPSNQESVE